MLVVKFICKSNCFVYHSSVIVYAVGDGAG